MPKKVHVYKKKQKVPETEIISKLQADYKNIDDSKIKKFSDFPLSFKTLKGLNENNFVTPSEVQRKSIGLILQGFDVLASAQTGSGKTLAFLIPVLEILYCNQWTHMDGLGALIITPCRELAYQIYETMTKISVYHKFTSGLIIGGKDLKFERKRMDKYNIIVCTPGRLLQHMDENEYFNCNNLQVLVLDEADRCLDLGFRECMDGIIANLPLERRTLLFSATLTKSVHDLARLSLKNPRHVFIHEYSTPEGLQQNYVICNLSDKISILWSFIRTHLKQKCIVFFQSCKQVKYIHEVFCKMQPGVSLLALYGTLHQMRRMTIYDQFCRKQHAILFATDIAARGLDFPVVDWVVQMDCPEDTDAYVHRAGRTARFERGGESLLVLLPSEIEMIEKLKHKKLPINKININVDKLQNPEKRLNSILAANVEYKESAKRAFLSYIKSIYLMKDKSIFDVSKLDYDAYARSLGLLVIPRVRFLKRKEDKIKKNEEKKEIVENPFADLSDESDAEDVLKVKRINIDIDKEVPHVEIETEEMRALSKKPITKAAIVKKMLKKNIVANKKTEFDEEGNEIIDPSKTNVTLLSKKYENNSQSGIDIELAKQILREEDKIDKEKYRERIKEKHKEQKKKLKAQKRGRKDDEESGEGSDEEYSSDSDDGPDLSWLPDPDKIYGKEKNSDDENSEEEEDDDDDDDDDDEEEEEEESDEEIENEEMEKQKEKVQMPAKRRHKLEEQLESKKKRITPLNNLQMDEALALQLLGNSSS